MGVFHRGDVLRSGTCGGKSAYMMSEDGDVCVISIVSSIEVCAVVFGGFCEVTLTLVYSLKLSPESPAYEGQETGT